MFHGSVGSFLEPRYQMDLLPDDSSDIRYGITG